MEFNTRPIALVPMSGFVSWRRNISGPYLYRDAPFFELARAVTRSSGHDYDRVMSSISGSCFSNETTTARGTFTSWVNDIVAESRCSLSLRIRSPTGQDLTAIVVSSDTGLIESGTTVLFGVSLMERRRGDHRE